MKEVTLETKPSLGSSTFKLLALSGTAAQVFHSICDKEVIVNWAVRSLCQSLKGSKRVQGQQSMTISANMEEADSSGSESEPEA